MKRLALAMLLAMPLFAAAQQAVAPATETDEQRFVRLTRQIETEPLGQSDLATGWLVGWAADTPDYMVTVCPMAGPDWNMDDPFATQLLVLSMTGNVAYQIEHGKEADELSKQLAGTETALRIYSATIAKDASKRSPYFDSLVARQKDGTLRAFIAPFVQSKCAGGDKTKADA